MTKFNILAKIFCYSFLTLGLVRCGSDKPGGGGTNSWQLAEPMILQDNKEPMAFRKAENTLSMYSVNDALEFSDLDNQALPTLEVRTQCYLDEKTVSHHHFKEPLKSKYYFYQFLSPAQILTLNMNTKAKFNCHFDFLAVTSGGQSHRFKTRNVVIQPAIVPLGLELLKEQKIFSTAKSKKLVGVSIPDLATYQVDGSASKTPHLKLECSTFQSEVQGFMTPVNLNKFEIPNDKKGSSGLAEPCILIEVNAANKIEQLSSLFFLVDEAPKVQIRKGTLKHEGYYRARIREVLDHYVVQNLAKFPIDIEVNSTDGNLLNFTYLTRTPGYKSTNTLGYSVDQEFELEARGGTTVKTTQGWRVTLGPYQETSLIFFIRTKSMYCGSNAANGFVLTTHSRTGLQIQVARVLPTQLSALKELGFENSFFIATELLGPIQIFGTFTTSRGDNFAPPSDVIPQYTIVKPGTCAER